MNRRSLLVAVVILTASKEDEDLVQSSSLGANAYVRKAVKFAEFAKAATTLGLCWLPLDENAPGMRAVS